MNENDFDLYSGENNNLRNRNLISHQAVDIHRTTQRSHTLERQYIRPNTKKAPMIGGKVPVKFGAQSIDVKRTIKPAPKQLDFAPKVQQDIAPKTHPIVKKAMSNSVALKSVRTEAPKPSQVIKQEAIKKAMKSAPSHNDHKAKKQATLNATKKSKKVKSSWGQKLSLASASLAILLLGGYFTYLNMPHISVKVAAAQAGINAKFPNYQPSGYSLSGPVAYRDGEVNMKFIANAGPQSFTISQTKTNWDSNAVLENFVEPKAGKQYITSRDNGLTVYTFGENATWVNNGILYNLAGDAPLSGEQIRRIATSL